MRRILKTSSIILLSLCIFSCSTTIPLNTSGNSVKEEQNSSGVIISGQVDFQDKKENFKTKAIENLLVYNFPEINPQEQNNSPKYQKFLEEYKTKSLKMNSIIEKINQKINFNLNFSTKANVSDISTEATISVIYPPNHPTKAGITLATGLTDIGGNFSINPGFANNFVKGEIYILEASKRFGTGLSEAGKSIISLRT
jgi:hypothetical protein